MLNPQPNSIGWCIARLCLWTDAPSFCKDLYLTPSHRKFILPVAHFRSQIQLDERRIPNENWDGLTLTIQDSALPEINKSYKQLLDSPTWELWLDEDENFLIVGPEQDPPRMIHIDREFSKGEIIADFSSNPQNFVNPLGDLEIRLFSVWLSKFSDLILHASGVIIDKEGYAFLGTSGIGKSTLASTLSKKYNLRVLGEDQVILRYIGGQFWIFGTPWHENPDMCSPQGVPLKKLFFLKRNQPYGIRVIKPSEGVTNVLQTAVVPYYRPDLLPNILDRLSLLSEQIPFYTLSYQMGENPLPTILGND